jgi:uncharacterized protein (DUF2267 family)
MRQEAFLALVQRAAGISPQQAEAAARATLRTLAERITLGDAEDVAAFLPSQLRGDLLSAPEPVEPYGVDEFVRRVAARERVDRDTAEQHVRAVFAALRQAVAPAELRDVAAQFAMDFAPLLVPEKNGHEPEPPRDPLVHRVSELAALDPGTARRAVEAVLEALAVRISEGEVKDLMKRLGPELDAALERGLWESRKATRMSLDEFLDRVAERVGIDHEEAERITRAVFAALREVVSGKEIHDVESELPKEYAPLFSGVV